ncbi:hypothetical protein FSP39_012969 [Pinctada imbricata]|uniref:Reverse transcriptase domain-containing protein n=1 Tax=Pinctada imbricata TaxID=66713 RepID=A0AA88YMK3_PINIB|nr:hypothetical protein FSP39_012969 [Pinctada imbricata]
MSYLEDIASDFDVICVTETHLDSNVPNSDVTIDGYDIIRQDRSAHGGGILVYISTNLYVNRLHPIESNNEDFEYVWLEVKSKRDKFLLCIAYRPPSQIDAFWTEFEHSIDTASDINPKLVIVGDLNVDLLTESSHKLNNIMNIYQLNNVIDTPTRIGPTRQSLLDPVLIRECSFCFSEVIPIERTISDHNATVIDLIFELENRKCYKRKVWCYESGDYVSLNEEIQQFDWSELLSVNDIDDACLKFTDKFLALINKYIPSKMVTIRNKDKPWFNSFIRREIRKRDRLRKKAKLGIQSFVEKYKKQRNHVNNLKKSIKQSFYQNVDDLVDTLAAQNSKGYWKLIKSLTQSSGKQVIIPPLIDPETLELETDDELKAELLNKYFVSISQIDDTDAEIPEVDLKTDSTLSHIEINPGDVTDILKILKLGKANGVDEISHHMLKYTAESVSVPLCILFNLSLRLRKFPSLWKKALIMPIYKKDDKHLPSNYRPISLLSTVGKVFERCVFKYLYNYMIENKLFYEFQSGFLPSHSTTHQLIELYNHICINREKNEHTCLIFYDISKAFDKVWHRGLLKKLNSYGFTGSLHYFLTDYLSNREQAVFVNNHHSSFRLTNAGVPQGSVLGPFLFLIFINDIAENLLSLARLFADDTSLLYSSKRLNDIERVLNDDLNKIHLWANKWMVTFNPNKTEVLLISNRPTHDLDLHFGDTRLQPSSFHKHLGVTLSSDGKWSLHIDNICNSALKQINVLKKLKFVLSRNSLNRIYTTFILPLLEYACELWDGCSLSDCEKLEKIQYQAARIVTGLPLFASIDSLFLETGWDSLKNRREKRKLSLFYKIENGLTPDYLRDLLPETIQEITPYNLRNSSNYRAPQLRLQSSFISYIPSTLRLWSNLSDETKDQPTYTKFKSSLDTLYEANTNKVPSYFLVGDRKPNILLTRLRNTCSNLNADLFKVNLNNSPVCSCGSSIEDASHYLLLCPLYNEQRRILNSRLQPLYPLTLSDLLSGSTNLSLTENTYIQLAVQDFILASNRF